MRKIAVLRICIFTMAIVAIWMWVTEGEVKASGFIQDLDTVQESDSTPAIRNHFIDWEIQIGKEAYIELPFPEENDWVYRYTICEDCSSHQLPGGTKLGEMTGVLQGIPTGNKEVNRIQIQVHRAPNKADSTYPIRDYLLHHTLYKPKYVDWELYSKIWITVHYQSDIPVFQGTKSGYVYSVPREELTSIQLPLALYSGMDPIYSLQPELPAGLSFDPVSVVISGVPREITPATEYTLTVNRTDNDGQATMKFTLATTYPLDEVFNIPSLGSYNFTLNASNRVDLSVTTPSNEDEYLFAIHPSLPSGMTLNQTTGVISGVPTYKTPPIHHVLTVKDANFLQMYPNESQNSRVRTFRVLIEVGTPTILSYKKYDSDLDVYSYIVNQASERVGISQVSDYQEQHESERIDFSVGMDIDYTLEEFRKSVSSVHSISVIPSLPAGLSLEVRDIPIPIGQLSEFPNAGSLSYEYAFSQVRTYNQKINLEGSVDTPSSEHYLVTVTFSNGQKASLSFLLVFRSLSSNNYRGSVKPAIAGSLDNSVKVIQGDIGHQILSPSNPSIALDIDRSLEFTTFPMHTYSYIRLKAGEYAEIELPFNPSEENQEIAYDITVNDWNDRYNYFSGLPEGLVQDGRVIYGIPEVDVTSLYFLTLDNYEPRLEIELEVSTDCLFCGENIEFQSVEVGEYFELELPMPKNMISEREFTLYPGNLPNGLSISKNVVSGIILEPFEAIPLYWVAHKRGKEYSYRYIKFYMEGVYSTEKDNWYTPRFANHDILDRDIPIGKPVFVELPSLENARGQEVKYTAFGLPSGLSIVNNTIVGTPSDTGIWHIQYIAGWSPVCYGGETWIDVNVRRSRYGGLFLIEYFNDASRSMNMAVSDDWLDGTCRHEAYRAKSAIEFIIQVHDDGGENESTSLPKNSTNILANNISTTTITKPSPALTPETTTTTTMPNNAVPTNGNTDIQSLNSDLAQDDDQPISASAPLDPQAIELELGARSITASDRGPENSRNRNNSSTGAVFGRSLDFSLYNVLPETNDSSSGVVFAKGEGEVIGGGGFSDVGLSAHRGDISVLASLGVTRGCDPPDNTRFCPDRLVSRGELASFLVRLLGLGGASVELFSDDRGSVHEGSINRLGSVGLVRGCNPPLNDRFCPDRLVSRGELASLVERVLVFRLGSGVVAGDGSVSFTDTAGSVHAAQIEVLASVGIVRGCDPPLNSRFCPDRLVSRAELATFLVRLMERLG